jgi:3D (Asp-Asp-Asp) domain-containing protein/peptidoglycan hydrolase CwlO-like protein
MPRRRLLPLVAIALAVLAVPAVGGANPSQSVASLRARDAAIEAKSRAAVLGLYSLDQKLASADTRLAALHRQASVLRAQRAVLEEQQRIAHRGTVAEQHALAQRIRDLYEQGAVEPLEIVFGSKSLDQAMTDIDNLDRASQQGEAIVAQLKEAKRELADTSRELAAHTAALARATSAAASTLSSLESARASRAAYISSLATQRSMTQRQISTLVAQAHAAQIRSTELARARAASPLPSTPSSGIASDTGTGPGLAAPPPSGGRAITVSATGYALPGSTATGLPVGWGIVAVDPSVIPLGTHMTVPGYGEAVAADTGGAIVGNTIDLWFPSDAAANAWGRRTVTIILH